MQSVAKVFSSVVWVSTCLQQRAMQELAVLGNAAHGVSPASARSCMGREVQLCRGQRIMATVVSGLQKHVQHSLAALLCITLQAELHLPEQLSLAHEQYSNTYAKGMGRRMA